MLTSYVRARWYSSVSGQWGSVDPIWPWQKAYQYVDGNPAMGVDPSGKMHPALASCLVASAITGISSLLSGDSPDVALCKALVSCAVAALVSLIIPIVPALGGCLLGAISSLVETAVSRLCDKKPLCSEYKASDKVCAIIAALISMAVGCASAGFFNGSKGASDDDPGLVSGLTGFIVGVTGGACGSGVTSISPKWE